jgi:outer membrane protein
MSRPHRPTRQANGAPWRVVVVLLTLLLAAPLSAQERPARVAMVDMQRLLDSAPQMQQARARLTAEFAERDAALREQRDRLAQMEQRLRGAAPSLPDIDAAALGREIETLRRSIGRTQDRLRDDLAARNREERDRVWDQLNDAVAQYARANDIDLVLPSPVLYASARVDITDRVLDLLRQQASGAPP